MIISAPILIPSHEKGEIIKNGAIVTSRGSIIAAGPANKITTKYLHHYVHSLKDAVLLPGLVNLHTHLELPLLFDAIKSQNFPDWVLKLIAAKRSLSDANYYHAARQNIDSLIETGTTTVGEICTHGASPLELRKSGLRAMVFNEIIHMDGSRTTGRPAYRAQHPGLRQSRLLQYGLSPHTPYTVSEKVLRKVAALSEKKDIKLAIHVAESKDELKLLQRKKSGLEDIYRLAQWDIDWAPRGSTSFDYLQRIGMLSPRLIAVHAVQASDQDIRLLKKSNVAVAHCPRSNSVLAVGRMPLKKFLDAGITVGLGTDSLASVPSLSMWDEMRYAYRIHRRDDISAEDIFRLATTGGAKALGLDNEIGTLAQGKKADIIAVPLPKKNTGDLHSDLLRETKSCIMTMVNGKILFKGSE